MSKAMLGIALIALNRRATAQIAHDEVADFLQLLLAPAACPSLPFRRIILAAAGCTVLHAVSPLQWQDVNDLPESPPVASVVALSTARDGVQFDTILDTANDVRPHQVRKVSDSYP
jgi:hypothetical protein